MTVTKTKVKGSTNTAPPFQPAEIEPADITAIHALVSGQASPDQQFRFVKWLERATAVGEMSYRATDRDTAFAEGKRFVGLQFFTLAKTMVGNNRNRSS